MFRSQKYLHFYQTRTDDNFVILDNGVAEGYEFGAKYLLTLASDIAVSEIVIPDTMGDADDTLAKAQYFARYAEPDYQYMFVLQGRDVQEVMFCLNNLDNGAMFSYVTTIGIPRHLHNIDKNFRINLTEHLIKEAFNDKFEIHFLGGSPWMREAVVLAETVQYVENFRGIDTSMPIYMGLEGLYINTDPYISRPDDFFTRSDDHKAVQDNIDTYLDWALYAEELPSTS